MNVFNLQPHHDEDPGRTEIFSEIQKKMNKRLNVIISKCRGLTSTMTMLLVISQGCSRIVFPKLGNSQYITHASDFNGTYKNISPDTSAPNNTLWAVLSRKAGVYQFKPDFNLTNSYVKLVATEKRKIVAQLYEGDVLREELLLRGSIEDSNAFRLRQHAQYLGVPFVYMKLSWYCVRLRKNREGMLLADVVDSHGKMIFILSGGQTDDHTFMYLR